MIKSLRFVFVLTVFATHALEAQMRIADTQRIVLFLKEGASTSGFLMEATDDSLALLTAKGKEWFGYSNLKSAILHGRRRPGKGLGYGILLGTYGSVFVLGANRPDESEKFLNNNLGFTLGVALIALPGMAIGGGIGYLIDPGSQGEDIVFDFSGADPGRGNAPAQFRKALSPSEEPKVHLSIYGGSVSLSSPELPGYSPYESNSNFNWMRRIQITYSATEHLDAGIAILWFGEPPQRGYWSSSSAPNVSEYANMTRNFDALGYFAVVQFRPFSELLLRNMDILVGGGIGVASIHHQIDYTWSRSSYDTATFQSTYTIINGSQAVDERPLSGFLAGEANVHIYSGLSLGFSVDHVFGPARRITGIPFAGVESRTLRLGNTSVGFGMGIHF